MSSSHHWLKLGSTSPVAVKPRVLSSTASCQAAGGYLGGLRVSDALPQGWVPTEMTVAGVRNPTTEEVWIRVKLACMVNHD